MAVYAHVRGRGLVRMAPALGATAREVLDGLAKNALTGSAVPFAGVLLETAGGEQIPYEEIDLLTDSKENPDARRS